MNKINEILEFNKKFVEDKEYTQYITSKDPTKKMVILSCMDARLTELLPKALDLKNGDVKLIKNAGATISHPFGVPPYIKRGNYLSWVAASLYIRSRAMRYKSSQNSISLRFAVGFSLLSLTRSQVNA